MSSFTITNEMREKVADQLTVKAVQKHAKPIAKAIDKMRSTFWDAHAKNVDKILQIDRSRWPELIQQGLLTSISRVELRVSGKGEVFRIMPNRRDAKDEAMHKVGRMVLLTPEFASVWKHMRYDNYSYLCLHLDNESGSVPRLNSMEYFPEDHALIAATLKVRSDILAIFAAAYEFREKAMAILSSCRTARQLEELFPEAAKLLPRPVKRTNELAPVELVESVRGLMEKGVPDLA